MKTAPHNSKQSFITIPAGPNERQRARKLAKKNPGFTINVRTKKNHLVYSAKLDSNMMLTHPSIVLDCIIYICNKSIITNVIFVNYYFPPDWEIHDKIVNNRDK